MMVFSDSTHQSNVLCPIGYQQLSFFFFHNVLPLLLNHFQFSACISMKNIAEEAMEAVGNHLLPDGIDFCRNSSVADIFQFNFSQYDYPGEGGGPWPPPLGVISGLKIAFCVVNMIVSILGNTAVMIAVYHNPVLRSTINFYLVCSFI